MTNGTALSGKFPKEYNLSRNNQVFENFLLGIIVPFNFIPGISGGERGMLPIRPKIPVSISVIDWNFWEKRGQLPEPYPHKKISYGEFLFHLTFGNFPERLRKIYPKVNEIPKCQPFNRKLRKFSIRRIRKSGSVYHARLSAFLEIL